MVKVIQVATAVDYFQRVTGRKYQGEDIDVMGRLVQEILNNLEDEADTFTLVGFPREIHLTIDIDGLDRFTDLQLSVYNDLWWASDEVAANRFVDRQKLLNDKLKRIEQRRYYRYVKDVLLCLEDGEFGGVGVYYKFPKNAEVLGNGMDFYFFRIGEMTIEALVSRYSTYELLTFIRILAFAAQRPFILGTSNANTTRDEIAAILMDLTEQINVDPRTYMTDTAPIVTHKDWSYNLWIVDHYALMERIVDYGLNADETPGSLQNTKDTYHKLAMAQMDNNFWRKGYEFLNVEEQIVNTTLYSIPSALVVDEEWPLFFGKGDGVQKFKVFSQWELDALWNRDLQFTDPSVRGSTFSLRQIKSLLQIDTTQDFLRKTIIALIPKVVWRNPLDDLPHISKSALILLFNIGVQLADIDVTILKVDYREFDVKATNPTIDPNMRSRVREAIFGSLNRLTAIADIDKLWYVDPRGYKIDNTNNMWTLYGVILLLVDCNKYALFDTVSYFGGGFMTTASHYMKLIHGQELTRTILQFDPTEATIRNNNAFPGDFNTMGDSGME